MPASRNINPRVGQGKFNGQIVLITGASSGIGAALAREFAREGAHTILVARSADRIHALAHELTRDGIRSLAVAGDVTRDGDLEAAVQCARSEFGRLDVVIANAGFSVKGEFRKLSLDDYRRQWETNVFGVLRTLYAALPELEKSRGRIVLIGSLLGMVSFAGGTAYSMSKFALTALADGISQELAPYGVSVTHVMAGFMDTGIYNVDNHGVRHDKSEVRPPDWIIVPAERAARQIVSAAYRRKRSPIITGHAKALIFLQRHFPSLVHFSVSRTARKVARREQA